MSKISGKIAKIAWNTAKGTAKGTWVVTKGMWSIGKIVAPVVFQATWQVAKGTWKVGEAIAPHVKKVLPETEKSLSIALDILSALTMLDGD